MIWLKQNWFKIIVISLLILIFTSVKNNNIQEISQPQISDNDYCDSQDTLARLDDIKSMLNNLEENQLSLLRGHVDSANGQVDILRGQSDILAQIVDSCRY